MQGMLIQSVKDMDSLTEQQRKDAGRWPPIGRGELKQSVDVLLRNSKLSTFPKGDDAAGVFNAVKFILGSGDSPLTREEYVMVAHQYSKGRDACRAVFESFTEAQQAEAKNIVRQIRQADEANVRQVEEEEEAVRRVRARIAAEEKQRASTDAAAAVPPRKKTLKELEEANARAFSTAPPTASLYGVSAGATR